MKAFTRFSMRVVAQLGVITSIALFTQVARAQREGDKRMSGALDLDYAIAIGEGDTDNGAGGALRFGYDLNLTAFALTPEIGLAYHGFDGSSSPAVYRAFVGGRYAFSGLLQPVIFGRFGVAHLDETVSATAPTVGLGFALNLTLLPMFDFGAHTSYELVFGTDRTSSFDWLNLGFHAVVKF